ncbi:CoA-transferase family III domain [Pseudocohnilembus persalinus]|uniref:CoA-transferase family III domain n=1 Tax=Pseudocohnilembus persalinus TaxID=266149 RepID=A0A0V0QN09_PSEPJ|nr:CoA-transferase family III domain [Pseudocohnilembus persalinus]|eukprot:KRX03622.1 CoA-transferase family III domain [Pseudocohnilembus persalinus]
MSLPLQGLKVIELEGLAPSVFTGMVLADFGADVTIINKPEQGLQISDISENYMNRGKKSICMDLKNQGDILNLKIMLQQADVLIDCYRPGILEKLGLSPEELQKNNPKLIICRITGFGQTGSLSKIAGHDINYVAMSGMLSLLGKQNQPPQPPINLLADFGAGGSFGVIGILMALYDRNKTQKGQIIDVSMTETTGYLGSFIDSIRNNKKWNDVPGTNLLDGGAANYRCYKTKDGKYMAVGSLEPQFYERFVKGTQINPEKLEGGFDKNQELFEQIFLKKTQKEWTDIYNKLDCCVTPVLNLDEVKQSKYWNERNSLITMDGKVQFAPQPKLSSVQHYQNQHIKPSPKKGQDQKEIYKIYGIKPKL